MKRQLPSSSQDSYRAPSTQKKKQKQGNLEMFVNVQKPVKLEPPSFSSDRPSDSSNATSSKSTLSNHSSLKPSSHPLPHSSSLHPSSKPLQSTHQQMTYSRLSIDPDQKQQLMQKYLNPSTIYTCTECLNDITTRTKILIQNNIYCTKCATQYLTQEYTVIRDLQDQCLDQFAHQRLQEDMTRFRWNLKDQLNLLEAIEMYGIDSYELIRGHMKSHHQVDDIEEHQKVFIDKFTPVSTKGKGLVQKSKINQLLEEGNNKEEHSSSQDDGDDQGDQRKNEINNLTEKSQKILKILQYNPKRDEFSHHIPGLFELLMSEYPQKDLQKSNSEQMDFLMKGFLNEKQTQTLQNKILKVKLFSQKKQGSKSNQEVIIDQQDEESQEQQQGGQQEEETITEQDKWRLIEYQIRSKHVLFGASGENEAKNLSESLRLTNRLIQIKKEAEEQLQAMRKNYCKANGIEGRMTVEEFASQLPGIVMSSVFKVDQVVRIEERLKQIEGE